MGMISNMIFGLLRPYPYPPCKHVYPVFIEINGQERPPE